ncbi:TPA: hypothetical protein G9F01_002314 [Salmonella enterica]|nr:hypothetical protein [Salmonella enterica]HCL4891818.1 hypothetical protein [Salmonella enterica]
MKNKNKNKNKNKCPGCKRKRKGWPGYQPCATKYPAGGIAPPPKRP